MVRGARKVLMMAAAAESRKLPISMRAVDLTCSGVKTTLLLGLSEDWKTRARVCTRQALWEAAVPAAVTQITVSVKVSTASDGLTNLLRARDGLFVANQKLRRHQMMDLAVERKTVVGSV